MKKNYEHKFILFDNKGASRGSFGGNSVLLYPFRNISAYPFSFPFSGISRVRDALRIKFKPLLGDRAGDVSIIPFFVNSEKKLSSGCVFMLFGGEITKIEEHMTGQSENYIVWPVPLAFAGEVKGDGLIVWTDEDLITTVWVDGWIPIYYKTAARDESDPAAEEEMAREYIEQHGRSVENVFIADKGILSEPDIQSLGSSTLEACPSYSQLDISSRGTNLLERREKIVATLASAGRAAIVCAVIALIASGAVYLNHFRLISSSAPFMEELYSASFSENSKQPLSQALAKLRSLRSVGADTSFNSIIRDITSAWEGLGVSDDISIETMRFGAENTDLTGTAKSNESIQRLRVLLTDKGLAPKTDNIQQIPGGNLRFSLSISRGGK
jgi:hypothetical protein